MTVVDTDYAAVADAVRRLNRPLAIQLATQAVGRGSGHPLVLVVAAEGMEAAGRIPKAIELLNKAIKTAPQHKVARMRLATLLARRQHYADAAVAFDEVLKLDPDSFPALMGAGEMRLLLRDTPTAERHYRRASEIDPGAAEPLAILALMAAQARDSKTARDLAARSQALKPGLLGAEMAEARADLMEGAPELSEARLTRLMTRADLDDEHRAGALDVRADALDRLDRPAEAFADYEARNAILLKLNAPSFGAAVDRPISLARGLRDFIRAAPPDAWAAPGRDTRGARAVRGHVFLMGFPRSGTTLLEKALAGHPDIVTLEEVNHLASAARELRATPDAWERLAKLGAGAAEICRQVYWDGVESTLGSGLADKILIDKLPLHTVALPIIAKLFPDAKILFAVRDPRDVVLSCYRRRFHLNAAMFEFLNLKGAADYYDAVMALGMDAREILPLDLREVKHETLVADFDGEVGDILAFIGADWNPEVRNFAGRVGGQIRTPSYSQLAKGLNTDGIGQWRRYRAQMDGVLGTLEPWAERFGYHIL